LLFCAAASIALAPRQRRGLQKGKAARHVMVRCRVEGFDTGSLPGATSLPVCYTQGSASASTPAAFLLPTAEAAATRATAKALTQQHTLREPGLQLPVAAAMDVSKTPLRHGLSCARPALRVSAARHPRRFRGIGKHLPSASPQGRSKSARRAVGARLQAKHATPQVAQATFDPSRLRTQLQVGLQELAHRYRSGQPRSFKQVSTACTGVDHSVEILFQIINDHNRKM